MNKDNKEMLEEIRSKIEGNDELTMQFIADCHKVTYAALRLFHAYSIFLLSEIIISICLFILSPNIQIIPTYIRILYGAIIVIYGTIIIKFLLFIKNDKYAVSCISELHDNNWSIIDVFVAVKRNYFILNVISLKIFCVLYPILIIGMILH